MKIKIPGFCKAIFVLGIIASIWIAIFVATCDLVFCGFALLYIPVLWVFALFSCIVYLIVARIASQEKAVNIAIISTILAFLASFFILQLIY